MRPRDQRIVHLRDVRAYFNLGMAVPACTPTRHYLPTTGSVSAVTCKHCQRLYAAERRSA